MAISLPGGRNLHVPAVAGIIQEYNIKAELSSASRLQQRPTVEAFTLLQTIRILKNTNTNSNPLELSSDRSVRQLVNLFERLQFESLLKCILKFVWISLLCMLFGFLKNHINFSIRMYSIDFFLGLCRKDSGRVEKSSKQSDFLISHGSVELLNLVKVCQVLHWFTENFLWIPVPFNLVSKHGKCIGVTSSLPCFSFILVLEKENLNYHLVMNVEQCVINDPLPAKLDLLKQTKKTHL